MMATDQVLPARANLRGIRIDRHAEDLIIETLLIAHDERANRSHAHITTGESWLLDNEQHIEWITIIC